MNFEIKKICQMLRQLVVTIDKETFERDFQKVIKGYSQSVQINGFRKGKAPASVIRRFYEPQLRSAYQDKYMSEYYTKGISETNASPLSMGRFLDVIFADSGEVTFLYEFEAAPEDFEYEYQGLKVPFKETEYSEQMLDDTINNLLKENTEEIPFDENQTLEIGDKVQIFDMKNDAELKPFILTQEVLNTDADLKDGAIDAEKMVGLKINDRFLSRSFRSNDGTEETHEYKIIDAFKLITPELNDETAKILGHESLDILKSSLKENILKEIETKNKYNLSHLISYAFGERNQKNIKVPEGYLLTIGKRVVARQLGGNVNDELLNSIEDKMYLEIANSHLPNLIWDLCFDQVAKDQKITVSEEEIDAEVIKLANHFNISADEFKAKFNHDLEKIKDELLSEKVVDFIKPFCIMMDPEEYREMVGDVSDVPHEMEKNDDGDIENAEFEVIKSSLVDYENQPGDVGKSEVGAAEIAPPTPPKVKRGRPKKIQTEEK